ncbi:GATA transcription factor 11 [Triticum urartu]|uniref:GATA transcription factor 11 n=1 Tax=Triticum urartu TaxID=4572 RepID=M7ZQ06_TRIUA|nr:GATA transcription factor 11 [Triticum urartu]
MASGRFMEEMMREHEQSLLEATCGGLFDHIEDLLDFPKEDSAEDVLLLDAPEPECIAESNSQPKKKKKAKRPTPPVTSDAEGDADYEEGSGGAALAPGEVRRCTHCQIDKTPQWRAGPLGPKTLCNACGVRYKSGRLFPEYRPAASPTFVPAIHSNSHKKVVEMRQKVEPKGDDLLQFIRRRD